MTAPVPPSPIPQTPPEPETGPRILSASRSDSTVTALVEIDSVATTHTFTDGCSESGERGAIAVKLSRMGMLTIVDPATAIRAAFEMQCRSALGTPLQQDSVLRYVSAVIARIATGGAPATTTETADLAMSAAIDVWETSMIAARDAAITAGTPVKDITWPSPPAGLATFLQAF